MPRQARLDAPGVLQHTMGRGIEGTSIFRSDEDREDFLHRLAKQVEDSGSQVLAWALLRNHFHLLARTGHDPLTRVIQRVLSGYASGFNRRHRRRGHLFQNRFKSILVEEEPYLQELLCYIHLNPLRAGLVEGLAQLDRHPWSGHSALLGYVHRPWQAVDEVLGQFADTRREARRRYRAFVAKGARLGRCPELQGGGLRRSVGGWEALVELRRGRERWTADERILGSSAFVERVLREASPPRLRLAPAAAGKGLLILIHRVADACGVGSREITGGSRRRPAARARAAVALVATAGLGLSVTHVARALGVGPAAIVQGRDRGLAELRARGLDFNRLAKTVITKVK